VANFAVSDNIAVVVNDIDIKAWHRFAHGTGANFKALIVGHYVNGFGLSVAVEDMPAGGVLPDPNDFGIERFAGSPEVSAGGNWARSTSVALVSAVRSVGVAVHRRRCGFSAGKSTLA
jgi:hypothetical protein